MLDSLRHRGGFADLVGYRLEAWRENYAEVTVTLGPEHLNRSGVMHGGVLTTMIDAACGYAGCYSADPDQPRRAFTLSLEAQVVASAKAGSTLTVKAEKTGGGRQIFFSRAQAVDQDGRLVGQGSGTFRYRSAPGRTPSDKV